MPNFDAPRFVTPPTRSAHKDMIFEAIRNVLAISLSYTILWKDNTQIHDRDFLHWVEDVAKSLPMTEADIPRSVCTIIERIEKRMLEWELKFVEQIDPNGNTPAPLHVEGSGSSTAPVEQIRTIHSQLPPHINYEFSGNSSRFLHLTSPITITFTPTPSNPSVPLVPALSYHVSTRGEINELHQPQHTNDTSSINTTIHSCGSSIGDAPETAAIATPVQKPAKQKKGKRAKKDVMFSKAPGLSVSANTIPFPTSGPSSTPKSSQARRKGEGKSDENSRHPPSTGPELLGDNPVPSSSYGKKGKKRALEGVDEEEEILRYAGRLRSNSIKSRTSAGSNSSKISSKLSGMKNAVLNLAGVKK